MHLRIQRLVQPFKDLKRRRGQAVVVLPQQTGSVAHLAYRGGGDSDVIMDVHSHCTMGAFFSGEDTRDEQGFRLYGVVGRIFTQVEFALRVGVYGDFWRVPAGMIFADGLRYWKVVK